MEEVLLKIAENSPTLALLAIVLVIVFRMINKLITAFLTTLQSLNSNFEKLTSEVKEQGVNTEHLIQVVDESRTMHLQAHQYQKMEHEQMIKALERLNGQK